MQESERVPTQHENILVLNDTEKKNTEYWFRHMLRNVAELVSL
jgi:hypothetical protein